MSPAVATGVALGSRISVTWHSYCAPSCMCTCTYQVGKLFRAGPSLRSLIFSPPAIHSSVHTCTCGSLPGKNSTLRIFLCCLLGVQVGMPLVGSAETRTRHGGQRDSTHGRRRSSDESTFKEEPLANPLSIRCSRQAHRRGARQATKKTCCVGQTCAMA